MRGLRPVWVLAASATLAISTAIPGTAAAGGTPAGSVSVRVNYTDSGGNVLPVADAQVRLLTIAGEVYDEGCTLGDGTISFSSVPEGYYTVFAGPDRLVFCGNRYFLNPDDGRKMLQVGYGGFHGIQDASNFMVVADQQTTIKLRARTPRRQNKVCLGLWVTIMGTNGPDTIVGTPFDDVINAKRGRDLIRGMDGDDVLCGGGADDRIRGGDGNDLILGEGGDDKLWGGTRHGGSGSDLLDGYLGFDECYDGDVIRECEVSGNA